MLTSNLFFTERIKESVKLYAGIVLVETNVFVAHGRHISQFYLENNSQKFELRKDTDMSFTHYVKLIFKRLRNDKKKGEIYDVGVLLENGEIFIIDSKTNTPTDP